LCYRRTLGEEYLHELAIAESCVEFFDRCLDRKENEDPNLDSGEAVPKATIAPEMWAALLAA
jgi:hypothetical protein